MRRSSPILSLAVALIAAGPAAGQGASYDYCVACTGPQAVYLCTVGPRDPDPGWAAWAAYCREQVKVNAGHAACSVQPLGRTCPASRAVVFRGVRASARQAEALTSGEPEERRSAAAEIWAETVDGMRDVGRTVGDSAAVVGDAAETAGEQVWDGLKAMGEGMSRGTECIITFGQSC